MKNAKPTLADCRFCRLPKADDVCPLCQESVCRKCAEGLAENAFELRDQVPPELSHGAYCPTCFDARVAPLLSEYARTLERAKEVGFWSKSYRGHVPVIKKGRVELVVSGGRDRDHVLLRLGFRAAELGFNGLVHGELVSRKVRNEGYQKMEWSGRALPVQVDNEKLERAEFREAHWRVLHHR